jgi:hypothetical protein
MAKHFWRIEIEKDGETVFRRTLPGNLTDKEIGGTLQRLACLQLTPNEIVFGFPT